MIYRGSLSWLCTITLCFCVVAPVLGADTRASVSASPTLVNGKEQSYEFDNAEVALRTCAGKMMLPLDAITLMTPVQTAVGDATWRIKTTTGDTLIGEMLTSRLKYRRAGETGVLKLDTSALRSISVRATAPQPATTLGAVKIVLDDGCTITVKPAGLEVALENAAGKWELPLGTVQSIALSPVGGDRARSARVRFLSGYEETFALGEPGQTFSAIDLYGNKLKIDVADILAITCRLGMGTETTPPALGRNDNPGRTLELATPDEGVTLMQVPGIVWNIKSSVGRIALPTDSISKIHPADKRSAWMVGSEWQVDTILGETLIGKLSPTELTLPPSVVDRQTDKLSLRGETVLSMQAKLVDRPEGWLLWRLKNGEIFSARIIAAELEGKKSRKHPEGATADTETVTSIIPSGDFLTLSSADGDVTMLPVDRSVDVVLLCNSETRSITWRDVELVADSDKSLLALAIAANSSPPTSTSDPAPRNNTDNGELMDRVKQLEKQLDRIRDELKIETRRSASLEVDLADAREHIADMEKESRKLKELRRYRESAEAAKERMHKEHADGIAKLEERLAQSQREIARLKGEPVATADASRLSESPRLKPGLVLKVLVMASGQTEVNEPGKRISQDGTITLPLIGAVKASGLTLNEFAVNLKRLYAEYVHNPAIDVDFVLDGNEGGVSPWGHVTMLGRVKNPGRINVPPTRDLSLSMAIQLAGGLDSSAKTTDIRVTRKDKNGKVDRFEVDLAAVGTKGKIEGDIQLQAGDVVYVPERVF